MHYFALIISASWIVFILVWLVSALAAKRTIKRSWWKTWWRSAWIRIIIALIIYVFFSHQLTELFRNGPIISTNVILGATGSLLTVAGIMLALWARFYLGTNWGMPMSLKENRELVTTGPYQYVRHPIYTGVMLAMLGSALVWGRWLLIAVAIYFLYFIFSAISEEKTLSNEFPNTYPSYKKKTKMLIPFVF
jgi:protein-S-isoprenylcysteine O-methyltransferase Ste14